MSGVNNCWKHISRKFTLRWVLFCQQCHFGMQLRQARSRQDQPFDRHDVEVQQCILKLTCPNRPRDLILYTIPIQVALNLKEIQATMNHRWVYSAMILFLGVFVEVETQHPFPNCVVKGLWDNDRIRVAVSENISMPRITHSHRKFYGLLSII